MRRETGRPEPELARVDLAIVSYFNPADFPGGAERIAWAEAELLSVTRRVAFVSASPPVDGTAVPQLRVGGWTRSLYQPPGPRRNPVKLVALHLLSQFNPFVLPEALRLFRRLRPTVVHTHNLIALSPAIWLAARLSGARVMHTHQDLWLNCERATMTDAEGRPCDESQLTCLACRSLRPVKKLQIKLVATEIFPSRWLRDRMGRRGEIVPNFSTSRFTANEESVPPGAAVVLFIGGLTPHKVGALMDGFARASASGAPPMRLVIAGAGPLAASIGAVADSNPNVSYLGQVDSDMRDRLLQEASLVVIPSTCPDTCPLVFFEALAAGVPVVASDIGGITELAEYGSTVLVQPGDAEALAGAISALLAGTGRLDQLRRAARQHRDEASPERFAGQMEHAIAALEGAVSPTEHAQ